MFSPSNGPTFLMDFNSQISSPLVSFFPQAPAICLSSDSHLLLLRLLRWPSAPFPTTNLPPANSLKTIVYKLQTDESAQWPPTFCHISPHFYKGIRAFKIWPLPNASASFVPILPIDVGHTKLLISVFLSLCKLPILPGISCSLPYLIPICLSRFSYTMVCKSFLSI